MNLQGLRRKLLISVVLGIVVFAALIAYGDAQSIGTALEEFRWELFPLILAISLGNYLLRFVKWQWYLARVGVRGLRTWDSFLIFMSGLGMVITPGKVGEWLKCYLLKDIHGTPVSRTTPILFAERITDALGLMVLAAVGMVAFERSFWPIAVFVAVGAVVVVAVSRHEATSRRVVNASSRLPFVGRFTSQIEELRESNYVVMDPLGVVLMTALSVVAWGTQVVAFYLVLIGLGVDGTGEVFLKASFILPITTLAAALLLLPGGLGLAETGITSLLQRMLDLTAAGAAAGTLIIRVATLWFAVVLGLIAFVIVLRRESRAEAAAAEEDERTEARLVATSDVAG
jgi:uncharacterized protein (TIRG00374 family)